jgi:tetratricopeptide (TPR) repeat protein
VGQHYPLREVERLLGMSRAAILGLVRSGFVQPARGERRAYLFSFQDLMMLRAARALTSANLPARRITRSLQALRRQLPESVPLSGLSIRALGDRVVVQEGGRRWHADSGQYLLELDVRVASGELQVLACERDPTDTAEAWFNRGWELEPASEREAQQAYRRALELEPAHAGARVNLGRLLHEGGKLADAETVYRAGIAHAPGDALLQFNLGVLLEDLGRNDEAAEIYRAALRAQPAFADCHYNLALLYEAAGNKLGAIRHLREYRRLVARGGG